MVEDEMDDFEERIKNKKFNNSKQFQKNQDIKQKNQE